MKIKVEKDEQIRDLARLSRNSKCTIDPSSSHAIHNDNPQLVARAIEEVLRAIDKGMKLVP
jgi:hypothetical protein